MSVTLLVSNFLTALLWPVPHIISTVRLTGKEPEPVKKSNGFLPLPSHFSAFGAATRSFLVAWAIIYGLYEGDSYPAFGKAATFGMSWIMPMIVRNLLGTWIICGFWDWWLYFGPLKDKLFKYKIVGKYPSFQQMKHDAFYTTLSSVFAALVEAVVCHYYTIGAWPMVRSMAEKPLLHFIMIPTITHWRVIQFWAMHRVMHPWRTERIPDFGKMLYKWVHSLHHKSYNITAFSGTNMHPVESTLYYSACLMCIPLGVHPALPLAVIVDCAMGAWIGHDGHVYPGSGDYFHTMHHVHFDCNYGAEHIPIDMWMGEYAGSKEEVKKNWGNKASGREANDTFVHDDSKANRVE